MVIYPSLIATEGEISMIFAIRRKKRSDVSMTMSQGQLIYSVYTLPFNFQTGGYEDVFTPTLWPNKTNFIGVGSRPQKGAKSAKKGPKMAIFSLSVLENAVFSTFSGPGTPKNPEKCRKNPVFSGSKFFFPSECARKRVSRFWP